MASEREQNGFLLPVTRAECAKSNVMISSQIVPIASKLDFNVLPQTPDGLASPLDGGRLDRGIPHPRHR
jgi:hypothetical protein